MEKLWTWHWVDGGYSSCMATDRSEAIRIGNEKGKSVTFESMGETITTVALHVDEETVFAPTAKQMKGIVDTYSALWY